MIIVSDVWSFSGPLGRFRAMIRKDQIWLLSKPALVISCTVHHEILPAEGWQHYINCGQWPTTGGPTHAIPLPNLFTKRVPIT